MQRCKHQNGLLSEFVDTAHLREVVDGRVEEVGYNDIGNISGYLYTCYDCGREWKFVAHPRLEWLRKIYRQL